MMPTLLSKDELLALVPQQNPFRFIEEILELSDESIKATYVFKEEESFYAGHFPGNPVTPGVILLEASAQAGIVAFGIYLASQEVGVDRIKEMVTLFTEAEIEFTGRVKPGDRITVSAKKIYFRRLKIKVDVECTLDDGTTVMRGKIAGMGVAEK